MPKLVTFDEYYDELVILFNRLSLIAKQQQEANRQAAQDEKIGQEVNEFGRQQRLKKTRAKLKAMFDNAVIRKKKKKDEETTAAGSSPQSGWVRDLDQNQINPLTEYDPLAPPPLYMIGIFFVAIEWAANGAHEDVFEFKLEDNVLNGTADFTTANTHIFVWDMDAGQINGLKAFLEDSTGVGTPQWVSQLTYGPINYQTSPKPNPNTIYPLANDFVTGGSDPGEMLLEFISLAGSVFTSDTFIYTGYAAGNEYVLFNDNRYVWPAGQGGTSIVSFS